MPRWVPDRVFVDGRNTLYRACHAHAHLAWQVGDEMIPTGGVYGFLVNLQHLKSRFGAGVEVCWEGRNNFRARRYPAYKAKRANDKGAKSTMHDQALFDAVNEQEDRLVPILRELGIRQWLCDGGECDDVLGTLAHQYELDGKDVCLYSADSDIRQLVTHRTKVLSPGWRSGETLYDAAMVVEKDGVPPRLVADLKALAGDKGDNIPGMPGVGVLTAQRLIDAHGDIDGIVAAARSTEQGVWSGSNRVRETILAEVRKSRLWLYRDLTTIRRDIDLREIEPAQDEPRARASLTRLGCFSITDDLERYLSLGVSEME